MTMTMAMAMAGLRQNAQLRYPLPRPPLLARSQLTAHATSSSSPHPAAQPWSLTHRADMACRALQQAARYFISRRVLAQLASHMRVRGASQQAILPLDSIQLDRVQWPSVSSSTPKAAPNPDPAPDCDTALASSS